MTNHHANSCGHLKAFQLCDTDGVYARFEAQSPKPGQKSMCGYGEQAP